MVDYKMKLSDVLLSVKPRNIQHSLQQGSGLWLIFEFSVWILSKDLKCNPLTTFIQILNGIKLMNWISDVFYGVRYLDPHWKSTSSMLFDRI